MLACCMVMMDTYWSPYKHPCPSYLGPQISQVCHLDGMKPTSSSRERETISIYHTPGHHSKVNMWSLITRRLNSRTFDWASSWEHIGRAAWEWSQEEPQGKQDTKAPLHWPIWLYELINSLFGFSQFGFGFWSLTTERILTETPVNTTWLR